MPANLTPEYHKADKRYRAAGTDSERLAALEEMLRVIPKHKGTEHMRADLKKKVSKLKADMQSGSKKGGGKQVDIFHIPLGGAGQVVLIGTPNSGKSSIVGAMSNAKVNIADFEFSTQSPVPGMINFEDVHIEVVDMPPVSADYTPAGMVNAYRNCDIIGIVIDLSTNCLEQMELCLAYLEEHKLLADEQTDSQDQSGNRLGRDAFVICTKADKVSDGTLETFKELIQRKFDYVQISAETGDGLDELSKFLFDRLKVVRVYTKKPGHDADMKDPFALKQGDTVMDLANAVHRELAEKLKSAKIWGTGVYDGQSVPREHILHDKDVVELHFPRVD